jgi:hypothetical protein
MILASMRNWLHGGELHDEGAKSPAKTIEARKDEDGKLKKDKRVVVVHCKAGKGRSGTLSCSYLIAEEGWTAEEALARFTQRRMRPQFGAGVSIPSQLRWVSYVDRWTKAGKKYIDRPIEILEVHIWGLRNGVRVDVEGFEDEGKRIHTFHTFRSDERTVVEGDPPEGGGLTDMMWDLAGYPPKDKDKAPEEAELSDPANDENTAPDSKASKINKRSAQLIKKASATSARRVDQVKSLTFGPGNSGDTGNDSSSSEAEPGGKAVILKPKVPIRIPNSDVNISVERRNRTHKSMGLIMVTAVGHVWFNAFFEGNGPEQGNSPNPHGVFSIQWDAMDGIRGTSRKGSRALDRMSVVWRVAGEVPEGEEVDEPPEGTPVPQTAPADWKGADNVESTVDRNLGLRAQSPRSADVSQASSVKSLDMSTTADKDGKDGGNELKGCLNRDDEDGASLEGVRSSGPGGEDLSKDNEEDAKGDDEATKNDSEPPKSGDILENPDTAHATTKAGTTEIVDTKTQG